MSEPKRFTVTDQHLTLLRHANVGWDGCEFGAPAIDCKRPYGNSDVLGDIGEILGLQPDPATERGAECDFSDEQRSRMRVLHNETATALEIALRTGEFRVGSYETSDAYSRDWKLVPDSSRQ